jgi:hypothetical protein
VSSTGFPQDVRPSSTPGRPFVHTPDARSPHVFHRSSAVGGRDFHSRGQVVHMGCTGLPQSDRPSSTGPDRSFHSSCTVLPRRAGRFSTVFPPRPAGFSAALAQAFRCFPQPQAQSCTRDPHQGPGRAQRFHKISTRHRRSEARDANTRALGAGRAPC